MAIKHGSVNITVVKHGTASISTVYHGGTKVFPDATYVQLNTWLYVDDSDDGDVFIYLENPNSFSVNVSYYIEIETSSEYIDYDGSFTISAGGNYSTVLYSSSAQYSWVAISYSISGGGFSWNQTDEW